MIAKSDKVIKLRNGESKPFYLCSERALHSLIENLLQTDECAPLFFDGMDSFELVEKIGMGALASIEPRAPAYNIKTAKSLLDK